MSTDTVKVLPLVLLRPYKPADDLLGPTNPFEPAETSVLGIRSDRSAAKFILKQITLREHERLCPS